MSCEKVLDNIKKWIADAEAEDYLAEDYLYAVEEIKSIVSEEEK